MSDRPHESNEPDELGGLEDLPPDDPRVTAAGPRTRALLRAHREFVAPSELPEGARVDDAERRLGQMIERELGVPLHGEAPAAGSPRSPAPASGFWTMLLGPRMRPAFGVAALIVVAGGIWLAQSTRKTQDPVLRGNGTSVGEVDLASVTVTKTDGTVRLEWLDPAAADSYTIVFQSPELEEVARVEALHVTHYELRVDALPGGLASGDQVLWQVIAMRGADEIARSKTTAIRVP